MKIPALVSVIATSAIALAYASPNYAVETPKTTFICGKSNGVPATLAQTPRGNVPVIRWTSDYFKGAGFDPQKRCELVSEKFQTYQDLNALDYLTTGSIHGMNVVCVAHEEKGDCDRTLPDKGLLFTLKPGSNPGQTLEELLQVRVRASGPLTEAPPRVYINVKEFLNTKPVEGASSSNLSTDSDATTNLPKSSGNEKLF